MDMAQKIRIAQLKAELSILEEATEAPEVSAQGTHTGTVSGDACNTKTTPTATPKTTKKPHSQQKKLFNEIPEALYKSTFMKIALAIHENNEIAKNGKKNNKGTSWQGIQEMDLVIFSSSSNLKCGSCFVTRSCYNYFS